MKKTLNIHLKLPIKRGEVGEWVENESKRTFTPYAGIMKRLLKQAMEKEREKSGKNLPMFKET